jgi:hypothetical protein
MDDLHAVVNSSAGADLPHYLGLENEADKMYCSTTKQTEQVERDEVRNAAYLGLIFPSLNARLRVLTIGIAQSASMRAAFRCT